MSYILMYIYIYTYIYTDTYIDTHGQDEAQDGQDEAQDGTGYVDDAAHLGAQDGQDEAEGQSIDTEVGSHAVPQKPTNMGGFWEAGVWTQRCLGGGAQKMEPLPRKMVIFATRQKYGSCKLAKKSLRDACVHTCGPLSLLATPPTQNGHF